MFLTLAFHPQIRFLSARDNARLRARHADAHRLFGAVPVERLVQRGQLRDGSVHFVLVERRQTAR